MKNKDAIVTAAVIGGLAALAIELIPEVLRILREKKFAEKFQSLISEKAKIIHILELAYENKLSNVEIDIAVPTIIEATKNQKDYDLRRSAILALGFMGKKVVKTLIDIRADYRISISLRNIADLSLVRLNALGHVSNVDQKILKRIDKQWTSEMQKFYLQKEEGFFKRHSTLIVGIIGMLFTFTGTLLGIFLG